MQPLRRRIVRKTIHRERSVHEQPRDGAVLVEAALVLPVFFMVIMGIIEFGRAIMVGQMMTNSVREGVRSAIIDGSSNAAVEASIKEFLSGAAGVDQDSITVTFEITPAEGNDTTGNEVGNAQQRDLITVNVAIPFNDVAYVTPDYLTDANLTAEASMRHE